MLGGVRQAVPAAPIERRAKDVRLYIVNLNELEHSAGYRQPMSMRASPASTSTPST